jgi:putative peptidoglycan lipid II flippase
MLLCKLSIPAASVLFMVAFLISAALGVVRQVLFNAQFGAGAEASAYYAAFRLPDTLINLIATGSLSSAMAPVLLRTEREDGEAAGKHLANLVFTTLLVVVMPLTLFAIIITPQFVSNVLAPGFDTETSRLAADLTRIMLLQVPILIISAVAIAVMTSCNQLVLIALSIICHNVTLIGGILAARIYPPIGVYGPALGLVGDAILQTFILLPGLSWNGFHFRPTWDLYHQRLREVISLLIPNGLSVAVNYSGTIVDTAFASLARTPAGLSAIQNAFLLIGVPIRLIGMAVGQAAFPRLAAHAAAADWSRMRSTALRALGAVLALSLPVMLGLIALGRLVIRVLFERGQFDAVAGSLTYTMLVAYAVALPAYVATEIAARGLISLCDTRTPLFTNTFQVLGRIALIALLLDELGVVIIPLAFAATSVLEAIALNIVLFAKIRRRKR